jgi:hypothetical protein
MKLFVVALVLALAACALRGWGREARSRVRVVRC